MIYGIILIALFAVAIMVALAGFAKVLLMRKNAEINELRETAVSRERVILTLDNKRKELVDGNERLAILVKDYRQAVSECYQEISALRNTNKDLESRLPKSNPKPKMKAAKKK